MDITGETVKTKDALLSAAVAELEANGVEGLRIETILKTTGASFGSLYHHYKNRDGLITAAMLSSFRSVIDQDVDAIAKLAKAAKSAEDVISLVDAGIRGVLTHAGKVARARQISVLSASATRPDLQLAISQAQRETSDRLQEIFTELQVRGLIPKEANVKGFAWLTQQMVLGFTVTDQNSADISNQEVARVASKATLSILGL